MSRRAARSSIEPLLNATAVRAALYRRVEQYLRASIDHLDEKGLLGAVEASTPGEMIARVLSATPDVGIGSSAWTEALLRGAQMKQEVIRMAGGLLSSGDVAALLGISVAGVKQRQRRGKLLAVPISNGEWGYPAGQFDEHGRVRDGLSQVIAAFPEDTDPWIVLSFLANPVPGDETGSALEALPDPEALQRLVELARTHGEQGAT